MNDKTTEKLIEDELIKRIAELADYFYSTDRACDAVPCRITLSAGMAGFMLDRKDFTDLFAILFWSDEMPKDLKEFLSRFSG